MQISFPEKLLRRQIYRWISRKCLYPNG